MTDSLHHILFKSKERCIGIERGRRWGERSNTIRDRCYPILTPKRHVSGQLNWNIREFDQVVVIDKSTTDRCSCRNVGLMVQGYLSISEPTLLSIDSLVAKLYIPVGSVAKRHLDIHTLFCLQIFKNVKEIFVRSASLSHSLSCSKTATIQAHLSLSS